MSIMKRTLSVKCGLSSCGGVSSSEVVQLRYVWFQCVYPCISHRDGRRFGDVMTAPSVFLASSVCGAAVPLSGACYLFILAEVGAPLR